MQTFDLKALLRYLSEGFGVGLASYLIAGQRFTLQEILMISLTAAVTLFVLDLLAPAIGPSARLGAGFGLGLQTVTMAPGLEAFDDQEAIQNGNFDISGGNGQQIQPAPYDGTNSMIANSMFVNPPAIVNQTPVVPTATVQTTPTANAVMNPVTPTANANGTTTTRSTVANRVEYMGNRIETGHEIQARREVKAEASGCSAGMILTHYNRNCACGCPCTSTCQPDDKCKLCCPENKPCLLNDCNIGVSGCPYKLIPGNYSHRVLLPGYNECVQPYNTEPINATI